MMKSDQPSVKSAQRVLDILEWLALQREPVGLTAVAGHFGFPKSSTFALLQTLADRGYVLRDATERYGLEDSLRERWAFGPERRLLAAARPVMSDLRDTVHETVILGILEPSIEVRVVAKFVSPDEIRYDTDIAAPRPAYCTAMGRVLLADLPRDALEAYLAASPFPKRTPSSVTDRAALRRLVGEARAADFALVREEYSIGGSGAAAPVRDASGGVVAALNIATVTPRFELKRKIILREVCAAARRISVRLGYVPAAPIHRRTAKGG